MSLSLLRLVRRQREQAVLRGAGDDLGTVARVQLAHQRGDVELDGALAHAQPRGDLFILQAVAEQLEGLALARGERGGGAGLGRARAGDVAQQA